MKALRDGAIAGLSPSAVHVSFDERSKVPSLQLHFGKGNSSADTLTLPRCTGSTPKKPPSWSETVLFIELILLTIALNFGPNVSTFVLPAMV